MTNDSTSALTHLLSNLVLLPGEELRSDWARRAKSSFLQYTLRVFKSTATHRLVTVLFDSVQDKYYTQLLLDHQDGQTGENIKKTLINALAEVEHCGDYGFLYYLASPPTACVVLGDADGEDDKDYIQKIKQKLLATKLVSHVDIVCETPPDFDVAVGGFNFVNLGRFGVVK